MNLSNMVRAIRPVVAQSIAAFIRRGRFIECLESRDRGAIFVRHSVANEFWDPSHCLHGRHADRVSIGIQ